MIIEIVAGTGSITSNGVPKQRDVIYLERPIAFQFQQGLFDRALKLREDNTREVNSLEEFEEYFSDKDGQGGFVSCHFVEGDPQILKMIAKYKVTIRCMPLDGNAEQGTCIFTGQPSTRRAIFGRSY